MSLYRTIFYLLIVIGLSEVALLDEGDNEQQKASRFSTAHVKCPPTNSLHSVQKLSLREILSPKTTFDSENPREKQTTLLTDEGPEDDNGHHCGRKEAEENNPLLLVTSRTWEVDTFQELQNMDIDSSSFGVLNAVEIRHSSTLVECSSTDAADELLKVISVSNNDLNVERLNFRCHVASIEGLPQHVTYDDINYIMYAKYHEPPTSVRFVPYSPGWREDSQIALIDVNSSLLQEILESPTIPIQWIEHTIHILLLADDCTEDTERTSSAEDPDSLNYSQLFGEIVEQMKRRPPNIKHLSKFSIAEQTTAEEKSATENGAKTRVGDEPSHDRGGPSVPPADDNVRDGTREQTVLPDSISEILKETLARMLPLGEKTLLKIMDDSIEKALASLAPLLTQNQPDGS